MFEEIQQRWNVWKAVPFPKAAYELEDLELTSIDTFSAGCISVYVENRGKLDNERLKCLRGCADDLDKVMEKLNGKTRDYFQELLHLSRMVLASTNQKGR